MYYCIIIMSSKEVIVEFNDRMHFLECLKVNPGIIIVKFGANWCGPCKAIQVVLKLNFSQCEDNIICCDLDVDQNVDLYSFFKKNRQVNGIPTILAFFKDNISPFSNLSVSGADFNGINNFFNKCNQKARELKMK